MKNNPLKSDEYIQQLYVLPELMHMRKKWKKKRSYQTSPSFPATLKTLENYWTFANKIQEFDK